MTFGQRIKRLRLSKNFSQFAMHLDTGIAQVTIAHWERDHFIPSLPSVLKLCEHFGLTFEELMEGVEIDGFEIHSDGSVSCVDDLSDSLYR